jgi:hypothetical protein
VLVDVLGGVGVEAVRVVDDDLAGDRGHGRVVAEHRALYLPGPVEPALDDHLGVEAEGVVHSAEELVPVPGAAHPHRGSHVGRLDEEGVAERLAAVEVRGGGDAAQRHPGQDGELGGGEEALHHVLVHPDGRPEHPGADVRDAGQLEQALDRAVLAQGAVEHREDHVDAGGAPAPHRQGRLAAGGRVGGERHVGHRLLEPDQAGIPGRLEEERLLLEEPAARLVDAHQDGLEALAVEGLDHEARGEEGDLVLRRTPAEDDRDAHLP